MIYVYCNKSGDRIALNVCENVCKGECPAYEWVIERLDWYIEVFYDPRVCPACGGTGIAGDTYRCHTCDAAPPWRFTSNTELRRAETAWER